MTGSPPPDLEDLVAECAERIDRDGPDALEHLCREHPQHAAALRATIAPLLAYGLAGARQALAAEVAPATGPLPTQLGEFVVQREIGRGGMGVVLEALQPSLHRRVAIKVLPAGHFGDSRQVARFQNEVRAAATLDHPHIVPVHFVGQTDGHHWYAMHLVPGTSLRRVLTWLGGGGPDSAAAAVAAGLLGLPPGERPAALPDRWFRTAADLARQAAEALAKAHAVGILHRDVKPGNLLVEPSGHLWLGDFGLAHFQLEDSELTRSGEFVGTLAYSSPERLSLGTAADARSDVYSLGAALHELLVLRPPFQGPPQQLLRQVLTQEPPPPRQLQPRVPQDLDTIVRAAMSKEPTRRYQSAAALAADLRAFLAGAPITARPLTRWQRLQRWCTRNPATATAFGTALGLLVVLALVALVTVRTARERDRAVAAEAAVTALSGRRTFDARVAAVHARRQDLRAGRRADTQHLLAEARDAIAVAGADADERDAMHLRLRSEAIAVASRFDATEEVLLPADPAVRPLAFDGTQQHAAVAAGGELRVIGIDGAVGAHLDGFRTVRGVRFCGDDAWLLLLADETLLAWHWRSGRTVRAPGRATEPALCSTRTRAFGLVDGELVGLDLATGATAPVLPAALRLPPSPEPCTALQCSPDGSRLLLARRNTPALTVLDLGDRPRRRDLPLPDDVWQIAIEDDGRHALLGGRFLELLRVDLEQGAVVGRWSGHHAEVTALARAPAGGLVASAGWDAQLLLWDAQGQPLLLLPTPRPVPELRFHDAGTALGWTSAVGDRHGARRWRLQPPTVLRSIDLPARAHTGHPDLVQHPQLPVAVLADRDGITFLATGSWTPLASLPLPASPIDLAFRPDGDLVVGYGSAAPPQVLPCRDRDGVLRIGPARTLAPAANANLALHGTRLFSGDGNSIQELDADGRVCRSFPTGVDDTADLVLSPDGRFAVLGVFPGGSAAAVFDLATGARVFTAEACEQRAFATFSPDGRLLAIARRDAYHVFEVGTWRLRGVIRRPRVEVSPGHCAWSPDGRLLVAPIEPARLQVLDAATLRPWFDLEVPDGAPAGGPVFSADGSALLLPSIHRRLFVWDLAAIARELEAAGLAWPGAPTAAPVPPPTPPRLEFAR